MPKKKKGPQIPTILIGTYRKDQLEKWVLPHGLYNYAIHEEDTAIKEAASSVTELWLYAGKKDKLCFSASFDREVTSAELDELGYPRRKSKPHSDRYLLFHVSLLSGEESQSSAEQEAPIFLRLRDFTRSPKRIAEIKRVFGTHSQSSSDEQTRNISYLSDLPEDLLEDWLGNLCVCEAAEQLTFWALDEPKDLAVNAKTDGFGPIHDDSARKKRSLGQFFTEGDSWLQPQVDAFIRGCKATEVYDPFAGSGCLLKTVEHRIGGFRKYIGLDIDPLLAWEKNDSLMMIPSRPDAVVVTNPPYLSNYSAARKKLDKTILAYFETTDYDDLYLLALDRMLTAQNNVVAIVPETFVNSPYRQKGRLVSITILQDNPFQDTDTPVVVVCFDGQTKPFGEIKVFKDSQFVSSLQAVEESRIHPNKSVPMQFNDPNGWLGVRCVDSTDPSEMLHFDFKENIDYDWTEGIKISSRLLTLLSVDVPKTSRPSFIDSCNRILADIRRVSADVIFSPFKGNMKNGVRRRRLDFATCRAIVERAYAETMPAAPQFAQSSLF